MFIGVDGCKQGWIAVALGQHGFSGARVFGDFASLATHHKDARCIGVDMPVGLTERAGREADASARKFLSGQASSVFSAPARAVLTGPPGDYTEAQRRSRGACDKGLSRQSFAIVPKIRDVARAMESSNAALANILHEVHPEVSFRLMNKRHPLRCRKKTWGGLHERLCLLMGAGIVLPSDLGDANVVGIDDVVDAAAAAWSARRIARGEAKSFPKSPTQRDTSGHLIAIWG